MPRITIPRIHSAVKAVPSAMPELADYAAHLVVRL
jgi:hypothetical protein